MTRDEVLETVMGLCNRWNGVGGYRHWRGHTPITGIDSSISRANEALFAGPMPNSTLPPHIYPQLTVEDSVCERPSWALAPPVDPLDCGQSARAIARNRS